MSDFPEPHEGCREGGREDDRACPRAKIPPHHRGCEEDSLRKGIANVVILGNPAEIDVPGAHVIDPTSPTAPKHEAYAQKFAELRAKKGVTIEQARAQMMDATYYGTMMVKMGDADGLVSGACHSTANTLRPALQILKTAPGTKLVSALMVMCTKTPEFGADGTLVFADCGLNIAPTSDELSEIAIASANSFKTFMGDIEPKVAMLSYSTMGSAGGDTAKKVQEATAFAKEKAPELAIDGDLQLDAAIVPSVAELNATESTVAGHANVLVFPNLETGNIGYKLVQRFGQAEAYWPHPAGHRQAGERPFARLLRRRHRGRRGHHLRPGPASPSNRNRIEAFHRDGGVVWHPRLLYVKTR